MRLAVLTAKPDLEIHRELEAAAARQGHSLVVLDALAAVAQSHPPAIWQRGERWSLEGLAAVLPRVGNWRPDSVLAVLSTLQAAGVPSLNAPSAIRRGRDHWRTGCALAVAGLPHPETVAGSEPEALAAAAGAACGFPCVVKQRRSRQGIGVIRCGSRAELEAVLDSLWRVGDEVVVQRFCPPGGISRRVLVLDGEVLGATEHRAAAGEFRANAARGAGVTAVELPPDQAELARRGGLGAGARVLRRGPAAGRRPVGGGGGEPHARMEPLRGRDRRCRWPTWWSGRWSGGAGPGERPLRPGGPGAPPAGARALPGAPAPLALPGCPGRGAAGGGGSGGGLRQPGRAPGDRPGGRVGRLAGAAHADVRRCPLGRGRAAGASGRRPGAAPPPGDRQRCLAPGARRG